jgi:integrase
MQATLTNVNNNSLFNPDRKVEFLTHMIEEGTIQPRTSTSYARIFGITKEFEERYHKELAEFSIKEIEKIFYGFEANNRNTIESYGRIISSYLNWAVKNGYAKENYMTEKQLRRYEEQCVNYQDAVIMRLLFEGVGGKQLSEIRSLKKSQVDVDNKRLFLMNEVNHSGRVLEVEQRTIDLIEGAIKQMEYRKSNGDMEPTPFNNVRDYTDLVDNEYVVRASITKTENFHSPVDKFVIYRRIETIAKSLGIEDLTAKFIQRSGMVHQASKLMKDGELSLDDLKLVADRFNMKSYHNLKGFLTANNVSKVYGKG